MKSGPRAGANQRQPSTRRTSNGRAVLPYLHPAYDLTIGCAAVLTFLTTVSTAAVHVDKELWKIGYDIDVRKL